MTNWRESRVRLTLAARRIKRFVFFIFCQNFSFQHLNNTAKFCVMLFLFHSIFVQLLTSIIGASWTLWRCDVRFCALHQRRALHRCFSNYFCCYCPYFLGLKWHFAIRVKSLSIAEIYYFFLYKMRFDFIISCYGHAPALRHEDLHYFPNVKRVRLKSKVYSHKMPEKPISSFFSFCQKSPLEITVTKGR